MFCHDFLKITARHVISDIEEHCEQHDILGILCVFEGDYGQAFKWLSLPPTHRTNQTSVKGQKFATELGPGNSVPVFGIADIDTSRRGLETAGVKFDGETDVIEGMVRAATFYDPDGNAMIPALNLAGGS
ncbi:VOC family protein [Ruegeria hyattellae]